MWGLFKMRTILCFRTYVVKILPLLVDGDGDDPEFYVVAPSLLDLGLSFVSVKVRGSSMVDHPFDSALGRFP